MRCPTQTATSAAGGAERRDERDPGTAPLPAPRRPQLRVAALPALLAVLMIGGCGDSGEAGPSGPGMPAEGIARALAAHRSASIRDLRYDVRLSIPRGREEPVAGSVAISFERADPDDGPLILDFEAPGERVDRVSVAGRPVEPEFVRDHIVIPPESLPARGPVAVHVSFRAGDESLNRSEEYLYSLFVPARAHAALPVFDQPDLKARFRLELEVPESWAAVGNGAVLERTTDGGRATYRFAETRPIPTYLFAFAAGRFRREEAERKGRRFVFHHRETDTTRVARNREDLFDLHAAAVEWLEDYTGIDEPFGSFGFLAVPGFQYNGMEHPGAIYYRASSLFLDESTTQAELLSRASVVSHETSHLWFGDLVTMPWFDDVWMKEVFANFMAAKIVNPSFPELDHELRFYLAHFPAAYGVDRTGGTHPIRQELENLDEAGSLYGPIIYQKAPIVMRQLERLVGEEVLRDGLRAYLDRNRYGNASWPDLISILDERTSVDLASWSRIWVEEGGRPTIRARIEEEDGIVRSLRVEQEDPRGRGRTWPQSLDVVLGYGTDSTVALPVTLLDASEEVTDARGLATPDWVLPGGGGAGYGRFPLDPESRARLLETLPGVADPMVRGVGWVALWEELLAGEATPDDLMETLLVGARTEEVELNLQRILGYLGAVWWRVFDGDQRDRWASRVEETLWNGVEREAPATLRSSFFRTYRSVAVTEEGVGRLRRLWAGETEIRGIPLSEQDRTALVSELALREVDGFESLLDRQEEDIENPDRLERFRFVRPSLSPDPGVRERFFETLGTEEGRRREPWVAEAVSNLHHPLRAEHGRRFIRPSLELLEEIRRTGDIFFVSSWLDATLWGHSSPEAAEIVRRFLEERPGYPDRLRRKVLQSADLLFRVAGG